MKKMRYFLLLLFILVSFVNFADVFCPICKNTFKEFNAWGTLRRKCKCLKCGSVERLRHLYLFLESNKNLFDDDIVLLHWAAEPSIVRGLQNICKFKKYLKTDINCNNKDGALRLNDDCIMQDIRDIKMPNGSVDAIICMHVMEHIVEDQKAMNECFRVLKPGGWAIFGVPMRLDLERTYEDFSIVSPRARAKAFGQSDHVRWYGKDFPNRLNKAGFKAQLVSVDQYPSEIIKKYNLAQKLNEFPIRINDFYFCQK